MNIVSVKYAQFLEWKRYWETRLPRFTGGLECGAGIFAFLALIAAVSPDVTFAGKGLLSCLVASIIFGVMFGFLLGLPASERDK